MNKYDIILDGIRALANEKQPDTNISQLLYTHNCFFLLSRVKTPDKYTIRCKKENFLNSIRIRERYLTCRELFDILQYQRISYAVIKGAVLSNAIYGSPYVRKSGDIDLLIHRNNIDTIKNILMALGFIQGRVTKNGIEPFSRQELLFQTAFSHQVAPFVKKGDNPYCPYIEVDVNIDILWGESNKVTDMDFVLSHTETITICDQTVHKLSRELEFISLCLHHYKDVNSLYLLAQGNLKLNLFCDIYFYIKKCPPNILKLKSLCGQLEVLDYIYYCVYYANQIFNDPALVPYLAVLKTEKSEALLATFGLAEKEKYKWEIPFFERLFSVNIDEYLATHLSVKDLEKIRINKEYM